MFESLSNGDNNAPTKTTTSSATDHKAATNLALVAEPELAVDKRLRTTNSNNVKVEINKLSCVNADKSVEELKLSANQEQEETTRICAKADSLQTSLVKAGRALIIGAPQTQVANTEGGRARTQ